MAGHGMWEQDMKTTARTLEGREDGGREVAVSAVGKSATERESPGKGSNANSKN